MTFRKRKTDLSVGAVDGEVEGHGEETAIQGVGTVAGNVETAGVGLLEVVARIRFVESQR